MSWLKRLYGGENPTDKELFLKDVPPSKGKNGYHSISKGKLEKKWSTEKSLKEKKVVCESDDKLVQDCSLADLVFLSKRELDDFSAPSLDDGDMLLGDAAAGDLVERNTLDEAKIKQGGKSHASKNPVRYCKFSVNRNYSSCVFT